MSWSLEGVVGRDGVVREHRVTSFPCLLGRQPGLDCVIANDSISRKHALLQLVGGDLFIVDLNSSNGTFVNRVRVQQPTGLKEGDEIRLGDVILRLQRLGETFNSASSENGIFSGEDANMQELIGKRLIRSVFQPVFRASDMRLVAYEILNVGIHPDLPTKPLHLFYIAEKLGLAPDLSELMRHQGVEIASVGGLNRSLLMNAHPWELENLDRLISSLLELRSTHPKIQLTLEIQEHAVTGDIQLLKELKWALARVNINLAFRDFGVCESRLLDLLDAKPALLKFDKVLIEDVDTADHSRLNLIEHLIELAKGLQIHTMAERIGTRAEFEVCQKKGFDFLQGFYLGKPQPVDVYRNREEIFSS